MKFSKIILFLHIAFLFTCQVHAQNSKLNCVTYEVDRYSYGDEKKVDNDRYLDAFRSLEYELIYNDQKSIYHLVEKMYQNEDNASYKIAQMIAGSFFYKDIESKEKFEKSEINDKTFYVVKDYDEYKWEITKETKIIDGYECIKATSYKEDFSSTRNKINKFYPTVWFAPSIPAPFGPYGLDGLPGLVLEGTFNGRIYFYATKIDFNCSSKHPLQKPQKGNFVSEKEFNLISSSAMD